MDGDLSDKKQTVFTAITWVADGYGWMLFNDNEVLKTSTTIYELEEEAEAALEAFIHEQGFEESIGEANA